jgi:hypothetical protein
VYPKDLYVSQIASCGFPALRNARGKGRQVCHPTPTRSVDPSLGFKLEKPRAL